MEREDGLIIVEKKDLKNNSFNVAGDVRDLASDYVNETGKTNIIVAATEPWNSSWTIAIRNACRGIGVHVIKFVIK